MAIIYVAAPALSWAGPIPSISSLEGDDTTEGTRAKHCGGDAPQHFHLFENGWVYKKAATALPVKVLVGPSAGITICSS